MKFATDYNVISYDVAHTYIHTLYIGDFSNHFYWMFYVIHMCVVYVYIYIYYVYLQKSYNMFKNKHIIIILYILLCVS